MRSGFTLAEVVVSLVLLEVAVVGVLGNMAFAAEVLRRTERLERGTATVEVLVDSLTGTANPGTDSVRFEGGWVQWNVNDDGVLDVRVRSDSGEELSGARIWLSAP
jgi:Tfp pilus assembly protein PilV